METARNCSGVVSSTAFVGSPPPAPARDAGLQRRQAAVGEDLVDQPAVAAGEDGLEAVGVRQQHPDGGLDGRADHRVGLVRPTPGEALLRPAARRRPPLDLPGIDLGDDEAGPSNTPTAQRPRRTSRTAARCDCRAAVVSPR